MPIGYRERGKQGKRETNIDAREKQQLAASHTCPYRGVNQQLRYML